ncbi:auxin response factor 2-like isoform X2 [Panicum virgatum]|uniref:auxin response factor 2-like isoform X2 n=1 Tax=Panicum virgatum TaxID=38727 RepID=UPI0019D679A4|nr:auxin response factor 2-like isoform X2 [Panicum virgatum]
MAGIDLNTVEGEEDEEEPEAPRADGAVCLDLWHACAGPVAPLPRKGSAVVYLPQGHLEHVGGDAAPPAAVPPHVFCRVVDVNLHVSVSVRARARARRGLRSRGTVPASAMCSRYWLIERAFVSVQADGATDEVYARVSLLPEDEEAERRGRARAREDEDAARDGEGGGAMKPLARTPHMFCKTLTASDTSTHGGFSVPRRAAEDCFPPLDYSLQRPSQELVAKDLHGTEWKFRHIYRGQPRRHLLTTGWSAFVNKKKLVSGDAVLFLRGEDGVLQLGVRRAAQLKNVNLIPALHNQCSNHRNLGNVTQAVALRTVFHICYNPRLSQSEFIVPYWKFMRSFNQPFSVGMRCRMRCTGIIIGSREAEPMWHGSKWKSLAVRWDDDIERCRSNRVSPWEIELTGSVSGSQSHLCVPNSKRLKPCLPQVNTEIVLPYGSVSSDFAGSARFHKVLQGQEFLGFKTHDDTAVSALQATEARNLQYNDEHSSSINNSNNILGVPRFGVRSPTGTPGFPYHCSGFGESQRFQKVLQGQEVFRSFRGALADVHIRTSGMYQPDCMHATGAAYKWPTPQGCDFRQPTKPVLLQASSPSSVLMFPQTSSKVPHLEYGYSCLDKDDTGRNDRAFPTQDMGRSNQALSLWPHLVSGEAIDECTGTEKMHSPVSDAEHESNNESTVENGCKIFGISLAEQVRSCDEADSCNANCNSRFQPSEPQMSKSLGSCWATVHEQRPTVGRVVDVSLMDMI